MYYHRIFGDVFRRNLCPKEGDDFAGLLEEHRLPLLQAKPKRVRRHLRRYEYD
jgi:hypothetical protein